MSDGSQSVRDEVFKQLLRRSLDDSLIRGLHSQAQKSSYSTVRKNSAILLGKIGTNAVPVLISMMSDGSQSVRDEVYGQVSQLGVNESHIQLLTKELSESSYSTTRSRVAVLLGSIDNISAENTLIKHMSDSSQSVRDEIIKQLNSKRLNNSNVDALGAQFGSDFSSVRKNIARLLGTIKTEKSLDILDDRLQVEGTSSVKEQIAASIAAIRG